jgi:hypothetical protein
MFVSFVPEYCAAFNVCQIIAGLCAKSIPCATFFGTIFGTGYNISHGGVDMRGETVIVRAFKGVPLARQVWDVGERVIYLASGEGLTPIGFPKEDVFIYDESLYKRLQSAARRRDGRNLPRIWSEAKPYIE